MDGKIIEVDGSQLEGGGQILRIALTVSALRRLPVHVTNIRGGRTKPGLLEQHLKGVELLRDMCFAKTKGVTFGSKEVEFWPEDLKGGTYRVQMRTAGSISLLLQVALPCSLFAETPTILYLNGGTNTEMAPQFDYTAEIFKPTLEKFGATFDFQLFKRGYFPKGGGEVKVDINPIENLKPIDLTEQGNVTSIYGWSFVAGTLPIKMSHQAADSATKILNKYRPINIERYKEEPGIAPNNGAGIILVAETDKNCILGVSALGKRDESPEETGKKAAEELLKTIEEGACVDQYCQDQILILMAMAKGKSRVRVGEITMHTKTAISVIEKLTNVKFEIIPSGSTNIIECGGS